MTTAKLDPDLLCACAAYLAHSDVYLFADGESEHDLLRPLARTVVFLRDWPGTEYTPTDQECDCETERHLAAIALHCSRLQPGYIGGENRARRVALAILAAPPPMLTWWCERLAGNEPGSNG